mmetsp:Transcript_14155/g.20860  ORF Transcript_14155/g.20860 Transcript_14155/m.20860 type:complete len:332 (+) Transcript_14155:109-1104(+)
MMSSSLKKPPKIENVTLWNGVQMPQIAVGTAFFDPKGLHSTGKRYFALLPERAYRSVTLAIEAGIRHIDTAYVYRTHEAIRAVLGGMFASGELTREDVFITSKIFHGDKGIGPKGTALMIDDLSPEEVEKEVTRHFEKSLIELGVGYVDLMLLHWPAQFNSKDALNPQRRLAAWRVLESMYEKGWTRAIGVSNFSEIHLARLMEDGAKVKPMVNQIETSVYNQFDKIIQYCEENDIIIEAYSPLGNGATNMLEDPVILSIAEKHDKNAGQIALRYLVQLGYVVLPRSSSPERLRTNLEIFSFQLDEEDMEQLARLKKISGSWGLPSPYNMS